MSTPQPPRSLLPKDDNKGKERATGKKRAVGDGQAPEREASQASSSSSSLFSVLPLGPNTQSGPSARRRIIQNACEPCRKRKVKCDGGSPSCSTCAATPQTECYYETDADRRRKGALRRDIQILTQQNNNLSDENSNLSQITKAIRQGSDAEVEDIIYLLRSNESYDSIAKSLENSTTHDVVTARIASTESLDVVLAEFSRLTVETFEGQHYGHTSVLGAFKNLPSATSSMSSPNSWISITRDSALIHHLLDMYFTWCHPIHDVFSRDHFLHDMETGGTKFCSSLLVNAVLAAGCHFSERYDQVRTDRDDPRTSGSLFITEARRLLANDEEATLTTVQALAVLIYAESMDLHGPQGFRYNQLMMTMAVEMGLHRSGSQTEGSNNSLSPTEISVRRHTFWACYNISIRISVTVGRLPLLPVTAINTPKLSPDGERKTTWKPFFDDPRYDDNMPAGLEQPSFPTTLVFYKSLLFDIANDMLFLFYAPRERLTSRILLLHYDRFQKWFSDLPECLRIHLDKPSSPQCLHLHLWYHACVINLFRPFMKATLLNSIVIPRQVCTKSAITIIQIVQRYHALYGLRRIVVSFQHGMMLAATVQIYNMSEDYENRRTEAAAHVAILIGALQEMAVNHSFSVRTLSVILELASRSPNIPPNLQGAINEGRMALLSISEAWKRTKNIQSMEAPRMIAPEMHSGESSFQGTPFVPSDVPSQPRSGLISRNSAVDLTSYHQPRLVQQPNQPGMGQFHLQAHPGPSASQIPVTYEQDFFWSAYPGQGIPMQLASMQEGNATYSMIPDGGALPSTTMAAQLSRDGFGLPDAQWYQNASGDPWHHGQQRRD